MATAEHEPITRVWGQSPQRGAGARVRVRVKLYEPIQHLPHSLLEDVHRSSTTGPLCSVNTRNTFLAAVIHVNC